MSRLGRLLAPPVFDDEVKTRSAYLLHVILWALILVPVLYVLITALAAPRQAPRAALEGLAGEAINVFLLLLLRRGQVRLTAVLQVAAFFVFFSVLAAGGAGVRGPAYMVGHGLTIVIAGVLLGGRGALAVTLASIVVGGILVQLDQGGRLGGFRAEAPALVWGLSALLFSVSALVQNLAARRLREALARARSSEAQYRRLVDELEAKNAELERFSYTVSHDLKSPLITLRGFLGYIESDAREGNLGRLRADLARVVEATDKMRRLLDELLELSRIGRLVNPSQDVPFGEVAREARELVRGRLEARGVAVEIGAELPLVRGDRLRLVEVVQNLLDNAAKFMGNEQHPRVEIGVRDAGETPVFFVRDNGIGIPPRHRERVFRLFEKLDPASEGNGVGLALVKRIVELHGGRVWVEDSAPAGGATFCFTLPLAAHPT